MDQPWKTATATGLDGTGELVVSGRIWVKSIILFDTTASADTHFTVFDSAVATGSAAAAGDVVFQARLETPPNQMMFDFDGARFDDGVHVLSTTDSATAGICVVYATRALSS